MEHFKKEYAIWKLTRQRDKWRYIAWDWGILWGIPMFMGTVFFHPPTEKSWFYSETSKYPVSWLIVMLVLGVLISALMGTFLWNSNERKFKKMLEDEAAMNKTDVSENINPSQKANTKALESDVSTNILRKIKFAWIASVVSGITTLAISLYILSGNNVLNNAGGLFDAILIFGMALGIYKKSRICAVLMFVYFISSKIILFQEAGEFNGRQISIVLSAIFFWIFLQGVIGTFAYHKHIKK